LKAKIIYSDFDGTLTAGHRMSPLFFQILDLCEKHKLPFVIVTGRSLSWAHFFMTHFDLPCVVAEGGGIWVERNGNQFFEKLLVNQSDVEKLEAICVKMKKIFPSINLSLDSFGRRTDRAIELYDLKDPKLMQEVSVFLSSEGATHSTSNVHLNFWVGDINKSKAITKYNDSRYFKKDELIFFGDSLNDESVFKDFPHTVGVSNISKVLNRLQYKPKTILMGEENDGPKGVLSYLNNHLK
jgi:hydroxymethylpyrimidine pyrophosphatase-like HAD family hydrolase